MRVTNLDDNFSINSLENSLVFKQGRVPIFQNKVYTTKNESKQAKMGIVELVQSSISGFIFNRCFDTALMVYDENYQNEQANSTDFQNHLNYVLHLLLSFGIKEKKILEIGCGKGVFFELMMREGLDCWGFDPTYEGINPRIIKKYFSNEFSDIDAGVIIMRHTLEHIPNPFSFIHTIARANNYKGYLFVEVPTFDWIVKKKAFWDIFYEHCNYFTELSLSAMFHKAATGHFFGDQYVYLWADLADLRTSIPSGQEYLKLNGLEFEERIRHYKKFLENMQSLAIWGAGAKGSTFLNLLDKSAKLVDYVIDINPAKQNKFIAGTAHPIFAPSILDKNPVQNILVMNETYLDEVRNMTSQNRIELYKI
jgi:2-polyprenyl-3-methyl-5-hydroxy-6-metoxy-1,4-benzoquinol methylase